MKLKLQAMWLLFVVPLLIQAQNIRRLSENEGLPQSFISGLVQDRQGFVWIGTRNGLARYDGHDFRIFQHEFSDINSLSSNAITHLQLSRDNSLWIKYETGEIDALDINSGKVSHILTQKIIENEHLAIIQRGWCVGENNTVWYLKRGGKVNSFTSGSGGLQNRKSYTFAADTVRSLLSDSKKRLWVVRERGLSRFMPSMGTFINYPVPYRQYFNDNLDFGDDIPDLHERPGGELMWTDLKNIFFFSPLTHTYRKIKLPEPVEYSVKWINTGPDGKEYFAAGKNIYSYDDKQGLVNHTKKGGQNFSAIQAFLVDRSGLIWTGGNTEGITQIDLSTNFEASFYKKDFATDVLTKYFNLPATYLPSDNKSQKGALPISYYLRFASDANTIWFALNRIVFRYDVKLKKLEKLPLPASSGNKKNSPIKGITLNLKGEPIVTDRDGYLYIYKGKWDAIPGLAPQLMSNVEPNDIFFDEKRIWITTEYDGLHYIDISTGALHKVDNKKEGGFPSKCLYVIQHDPKRKELFWIGSSQGLICFNKETFRSTVFSVKQGLPDNVIYSLLADKEGYLWLGTNKGLVRFDPVLHTVRTFTVSHGLPNNEFNRFHCLVLPEGKLSFGGINGYVVFNPLELKEDNYNPHTQITNIHINNVPIEDLLNSISMQSVTKLSLPYNENTLRLEYAALQFSHPSDIHYRYRLAGYYNRWIETVNQRDAVYTKIPPGKYVFEVNATNTTGTWSRYITSLPIVISPPWWNTWWAWGLYLLLFIISVIWFTNFRIRQRILKEEILLKQKEAVQLRELDEMKTRFFSNITHELRTPLTLILGPAEELKKSLDGKEQNKLAGIITKSAGSLLNLTNQLLEMSKLEAGALKPNLAAGDLSLLINKTTSVFKQEVSLKKIILTIEVPEKANFLFDAEMMERILVNLLSNAIRFTPKGGSIILCLENVKGGISIRIADSGPGIAQEDLPYIFNRFYRGNTTQNKAVAGSGIGLSLVKELVELQGGTINLISGTDYLSRACFLVFLPLQAYNNTIDFNKKEIEIGSSITEYDKEKPLILIVEDNKELADFIFSLLIPHYNVVKAEDGKEAVPIAVKLLPDIIISDVLMADMDGFELCQTLKKDMYTCHIPVILLTAKVDMESRLEGFSYGADDYITKPFSVEELLLRVKNRLGQQKLLRESVYRELTSLPGMTDKKEVPLALDPFLLKVYEAIDGNIDNDSFGVEELAEALHISRTGLHRKIKGSTNMTTSEMLRAYRLTKAIPLLNQNFTIAETAYKTGFGSPSYFTRSFKEVYGITPTEYIKKNG